MDALGEFVAAISGDFDSETATCRFEPAEVRSIEGVAADGETEVIVKWRGADIRAPYLDSYAPFVGDVVVLFIQGRSRFILGRLIGVNYATGAEIESTGNTNGAGSRRKRITY